MTRRRLIILLDGTWNEDAAFDQDTNIVRLRDSISRGVRREVDTPPSIEEVDRRDAQLKFIEFGAYRYAETDYFMFYERGVGTGARLDWLSGGAMGWGVGKNVRRAYKFLSKHYCTGSEIFVFGFSRGAYAARSLIGFLGSAGLLKPEHCTEDLEKLAWAYYRTPPNDRLPGVKKKLDEYCFPSDELRVACLGVFDTVGALGIPLSSFWRTNRERYEFHDVNLSPIVKLNLHALAIDEHRPQFAAIVWRQSKFRVTNAVTEQTWFAGTHSDIGGGYYSDDQRDNMGISLDDVSLDWMIKRLRHHYPDFPEPKTTFGEITERPEQLGPQHDSRTWKYRFFKPAIRAIGNLRPPELQGEKRVSYDRDASVVGESIHISALERLGTDVSAVGGVGYYLPRNLIENLPNLHYRYCIDPKRKWSENAISVTTWEGEIADTRSCSASALDQVGRSLEEAYKRLKGLGYDLSSEWNSLKAARTLAGGRRANACAG